MQKCSKCGVPKPLGEFYADKRHQKERRSSCKQCNNIDTVINRRNKKEIYREYHKGWTKKLRIETIEAYGSKCACCGVTDLVFLAIDHVFDDGYDEKRRHSGRKRRSEAFYGRLKRLGFPKEEYQCLCFNCNWAKYQGGCPHGSPAGQPRKRS